MKRRLNYTGRKRITRDRVSIRMLESEADEPPRARARVDLAGFDFPADARVVIEAYTRSTGQRFDCGPLGSLQIPEPLTLDEVDRGAAITFRVRVVDVARQRGRILGAAEKLRALAADEEETPSGRSLLPIRADDLGEEMWRVDVGDAGPELLVNARAPGLADRLRNDSQLQALILPAALRVVLRELVVDAAEDEDHDAEEEWRTKWLRFCRESLGIDDDPAKMEVEQRRVWISDVVDAFCRRHRFVERARNLAGEGGQDAAAA